MQVLKTLAFVFYSFEATAFILNLLTNFNEWTGVSNPCENYFDSSTQNIMIILFIVIVSLDALLNSFMFMKYYLFFGKMKI